MQFGGQSHEGPPRALSDRIASLMKGGCSRKDACMVAGVHPQTLRKWMKHGERLTGDRNHRYCFEVVTVAEGKAKARMVQRVVNASDWKAAAHFLKQRYPDEWGDKKTIAVEDRRIESMDKMTLLKELREQQQLLEDSIEAEGTEVPPRELPAPEQSFEMAAAAGMFDEDEDEPSREHEDKPLPTRPDGTVPVGVRERTKLGGIHPKSIRFPKDPERL